MTTSQECASHLSGDNVTPGPDHHNHLKNGAIEAFQKDLADIQKDDNKYHTQEHSASVAATNALINANMLPRLYVDHQQAVFVAGATADKHDLVISLGDPARSSDRHMAVVMDANGVYWQAKKDDQGHYIKDAHHRIGDEGQFENFARFRLGQSDTLGDPHQQAPGPEAPTPQPPRPEAPAPQPPRPEAPAPQPPEPSNFESKAAYDKFINNYVHHIKAYDQDDLNLLADCYRHMNRMDRVRILSELQTHNESLSWVGNSDYINVEEGRDGSVVVSVTNHNGTITSAPSRPNSHPH